MNIYSFFITLIKGYACLVLGSYLVRYSDRRPKGFKSVYLFSFLYKYTF
jgi:hypothetical protein